MVDRSDRIEEEGLGSVPITLDQEEEGGVGGGVGGGRRLGRRRRRRRVRGRGPRGKKSGKSGKTVTMTSVKEDLRDPGKSQACPQDPVIASRPRHDGRAAFFFPSTTGCR